MLKLTDEIIMPLAGVETKRDPYWEFSFSSSGGYAVIETHKNSAFALKFHDPEKGTVNFKKRIRVVIDE